MNSLRMACLMGTCIQSTAMGLTNFAAALTLVTRASAGLGNPSPRHREKSENREGGKVLVRFRPLSRPFPLRPFFLSQRESSPSSLRTQPAEIEMNSPASLAGNSSLRRNHPTAWMTILASPLVTRTWATPPRPGNVESSHAIPCPFGFRGRYGERAHAQSGRHRFLRPRQA